MIYKRIAWIIVRSGRFFNPVHFSACWNGSRYIQVLDSAKHDQGRTIYRNTRQGLFVKFDFFTRRPKKELFHLAAIFSEKDGNIMTVEILHRVCWKCDVTWNQIAVMYEVVIHFVQVGDNISSSIFKSLCHTSQLCMTGLIDRYMYVHKRKKEVVEIWTWDDHDIGNIHYFDQMLTCSGIN